MRNVLWPLIFVLVGGCRPGFELYTDGTCVVDRHCQDGLSCVEGTCVSRSACGVRDSLIRSGTVDGVGDQSDSPPPIASCEPSSLLDESDRANPTEGFGVPLSGGVSVDDEDWFSVEADPCALLEARVAVLRDPALPVQAELCDSSGQRRAIAKRVGDWLHVAYHHPGLAPETYLLRVFSESPCSPYALGVFEARVPNPQVQLTARRQEGVAPAGFMFTAEARGFAAARSFQDVHFTWSFDDPRQHTLLGNEFPWPRDSNLAYGPVASHT
ncbi:MAG: hypothetical protein AAFY60_04815, partial [Myxococcota bacterium]